MNRAASALLLDRVRLGSADAIDQLLGAVAGRLLAFVRLRMGGTLRGRLESRDIVQTVLLKACARRHDLEAESTESFMGWLLRIAENEIRDQADHHQRQRRDMRQEAALDDAAGAAAPLRSALTNLVLDERARRLDRALSKLTDDQREIIAARRFEGRSFAEIGDQHGTSADAARMRFARAMAALSLRIDDPGAT